MAPITFWIDSYYYKKVAGLQQIEEFTLHIPSMIWEWMTYFHLKNAGHDVRLSDQMPEEGIVVASACDFPLLYKPPANVLMVSTVADTPPRFFSQVNVSQNPRQHKDYPKILGLPHWHFINIWPQPGIIPRDLSRGKRFERIGFFGHREQLDTSLRNEIFEKELAAIGLELEIVDRDFNDYRNIDAVIAIRDFTGNPYLHKPNSKLINGWAAGVPVLATGESAFTAMRESPLDFIQVDSKAELLSKLKLLKSDPVLVEQMVANGHRRAPGYTEAVFLKDWEQLLFEDAQRYYEDWRRKSRLEKEAFYADQLFSRSFRSVKKRVKRKLHLSKTY